MGQQACNCMCHAQLDGGNALRTAELLSILSDLLQQVRTTLLKNYRLCLRLACRLLNLICLRFVGVSAVAQVALSSVPFEVDTFVLGPGRSSDSRFVIATDEALDEAMQHLERIVCGTAGASTSFSTTRTAIQTSDPGSDLPVFAALDLEACADARVGGGSHIWRCFELGHVGSGKRSQLIGGIGPGPVSQQVPGTVSRQPPFVAPLLACLYAGDRAHVLAAVSCWTAVASIPGAFSPETDEGAMPTVQGLSTAKHSAKLSTIARIALQGVRPLVEGVVQAQDWLYDCIDRGVAAQVSLHVSHRRSLHQLQTTARDKERVFKARESHLAKTLQAERRASQAALQASRFEAEKALSREERANSRMQEAVERADRALEDLEIANASLQVKQREADDAQRQIAALSSTVSDLRDENSSWRKQVDEMGRTMAEVRQNFCLCIFPASENMRLRIIRQPSCTYVWSVFRVVSFVDGFLTWLIGHQMGGAESNGDADQATEECVLLTFATVMLEHDGHCPF